MARRYVDLSIPITDRIMSDPPVMAPKITRFHHKESFGQLAAFFPGLRPEDLPDGEAWAIESLQLTTHNGTHMDAPYHYHSTSDDGLPAPTIDEAPLDYFHRPGVRLDFRHFPHGYVAGKADVEAELHRIGYVLQPLDIVLINTSAGAAYGDPGYVDKGCGLGAEATLFLTAQGIKVVGTDAWSWDAPFSFTAARYRRDNDASIIWEGHKAGRVRGYYQIEKLTNLDLLPATGFTVSCFPVKIDRGSAGWVRAVAMMDDDAVAGQEHSA
ncbi:cyclase family protein [Labrys monachus]|uniref:Kynurenine formamidase n=1 Tax=Labrys monachus TaxID=217067 RepID=A0ABU0FC18_9HYPH|nr:cyclase family protein [Labrys monachus]MDQ0392140.1 kynurenine formamidase [Labrys monachus]